MVLLSNFSFRERRYMNKVLIAVALLIKSMVIIAANYYSPNNIKQYEEIFLDACQNGKLALVKLFLEKGVNPALNDNEAIKVAAREGHTKIVELLLNDIRVNPLAEDNYALRYARERNYAKIAKLLEAAIVRNYRYAPEEDTVEIYIALGKQVRVAKNKPSLFIKSICKCNVPPLATIKDIKSFLRENFNFITLQDSIYIFDVEKQQYITLSDFVTIVYITEVFTNHELYTTKFISDHNKAVMLLSKSERPETKKNKCSIQ